jgi:beta-xylosidase
MGLLREDGAPKLAARAFANYTSDLGICQWFHFEDPRLDDAVRHMRDLGVRYLRTGLSWRIVSVPMPSAGSIVR